MLQVIELRPEEREILNEDEIGLTATIQRAQRQILPQSLHQKHVKEKTMGVPLAELFADEETSASEGDK